MSGKAEGGADEALSKLEPSQIFDLVLGEMVKDLDGKFWGSQEWRITVQDEHGTRVCVLNVNGQSL